MGDNPKAQKDSKKASENHDGNQSDSKDSHAIIECGTCGISFSDPEDYEKHMQGKNHLKKVNEAKLRAKNLDKEAPESDKDDEEEEEDDDDLHCDVCDKSFSGYLSYQMHIKGSVHAKNVKKQKLKHQLGDMPEVLNKDGGHSDDDDILPRPFARCNYCQKDFSGPEPYKMHLRSGVHKKKVKHAHMVETLKKDGEEGGKKGSDDEEEPFSKCEVCQKSFSGVMPYKIHMESAGHKKGLEKNKVAEELKEFFVENDSDPAYVCKECKKSFADPMAFKCHLEKNSHEKQKAKNALLEFLNAHPQIVMVYPFEEDESDDDEDSTKYYLICKLCHVSFSGPESAKDHVKSKKHIGLKKEKKLAKLLKEQQKGKESAEESDGKKQQQNGKDGRGDKNVQTSKSDDKKSQISKDDQPKISENGKRVRKTSETDDFELV